MEAAEDAADGESAGRRAKLQPVAPLSLILHPSLAAEADLADGTVEAELLEPAAPLTAASSRLLHRSMTSRDRPRHAFFDATKTGADGADAYGNVFKAANRDFFVPLDPGPSKFLRPPAEPSADAEDALSDVDGPGGLGSGAAAAIAGGGGGAGAGVGK